MRWDQKGVIQKRLDEGITFGWDETLRVGKGARRVTVNVVFRVRIQNPFTHFYRSRAWSARV